MHKTTLYFLLGVAVGVGTTVFALREYFEVKSEEAIRDMELEIRKAKADIANKNKEQKENIEAKLTKGREIKDYINYAQVKKAKEDLDKVVNESIDQVIKRELGEEDAENLSPSEGPKEEPYVITPEQYANEYPYFDKVTLVYYLGDGVLAYEEGFEEADINVGADFMNHFGEYETDVCYIRNEVLGSDFEILLDEGYFSDLDP